MKKYQSCMLMLSGLLLLCPGCKSKDAQNVTNHEDSPAIEAPAAADDSAKSLENSDKKVEETSKRGQYQERSGLVDKLIQTDRFSSVPDVKWMDTEWANDSNKWAVPVLKASKDDDIAGKLSAQSKSPRRCYFKESKRGAGELEVQLYYCVYDQAGLNNLKLHPDPKIQYNQFRSAVWKQMVADVEEGRATEIAQEDDIFSVYLGLVSPEDYAVRIYPIDVKHNHVNDGVGGREGDDFEDHLSDMNLLEIKPVKLWDQDAVQIRILSYVNDLDSNDECNSPFGCKVFQSEYAVDSSIFVGPKYRRVTEWLEFTFDEKSDPRECRVYRDASGKSSLDANGVYYVENQEQCPAFTDEYVTCHKSAFDGKVWKDEDISCE